MRNLSLIFFFIFSLSTLQASEVSEWFERESNQFLEIINNNEGTESENYERYKYFVNKNFAVKSIAYGLIGEKIIENSSQSDLSIYLDVFTDYLITTIYKLANSSTSSSITLKDVDVKNDIYIIKSEVSDKKSTANLYWKVINTGESYKIIDVIVENTSYFVTKKSEFNKIYSNVLLELDQLIKLHYNSYKIIHVFLDECIINNQIYFELPKEKHQINNIKFNFKIICFNKMDVLAVVEQVLFQPCNNLLVNVVIFAHEFDPQFFLPS